DRQQDVRQRRDLLLPEPGGEADDPRRERAEEVEYRQLPYVQRHPVEPPRYSPSPYPRVRAVHDGHLLTPCRVAPVISPRAGRVSSPGSLGKCPKRDGSRA